MVLCKKFSDIFKLNISESHKKELLTIMKNDTSFLAENNLIDYSVLLAIEVVSPNDKEILPSHNKRTFRSRCGNYIYHLCIIDYLQPFTVYKRFEIVFKTVF